MNKQEKKELAKQMLKRNNYSDEEIEEYSAIPLAIKNHLQISQRATGKNEGLDASNPTHSRKRNPRPL